MKIVIHEMMTRIAQPDSPTGEHAWVDIEFSSGVTVTVRVDECAVLHERPTAYLAVNGEVGKDMIL